ncbi:2-hydroxyacid dehydrogenase [Agromyces sp. PvR057]|uniref:2-hydroxyacid dehydrogenase n=1 Tax=Agromyces sp. PvR057 TaxID=3156403 RepID=UPI003391346C
MTDRLLVSLPGATLRDAVGDLPDGVDVVLWDLTGPAPADHLDLVVPPYMGASAKLGALSGVSTRLVQSQSIGYDDVAAALPPGHVYANAASVHETSTAELTLALVLAAQRGIPDFVRAAGEGRWAPARHASLADRRVLLIGYGGVGAAIEERLLPFEVVVTRVASRARDDDRGRIHGIDELPELLPSAEVVIVGVPLTDATTGLVDDAFLSALPDGALVVNIARGRVADTDAILDHATRGRLRFALDVTEPEPLPAGHPLFALPNVLVSPHVGGASTAMMPRMARLVRDQVDRMRRGEEPRNVVLRT